MKVQLTVLVCRHLLARQDPVREIVPTMKPFYPKPFEALRKSGSLSWLCLLFRHGSHGGYIERRIPVPESSPIFLTIVGKNLSALKPVCASATMANVQATAAIKPGRRQQRPAAPRHRITMRKVGYQLCGHKRRTLISALPMLSAEAV
ncbi:hypothetical protein OO012_00165 [Rhodobacteraceae bacterium KMM 6894]|nr:hypothetical protein [Rhodobacteraceae bacterium KMM 6894]